MLYRFSIENCLFFCGFIKIFIAVFVTFFAVRNVINHAPTTKIMPLRQKPRPSTQKNHALYMDLVDCYPAILLFFLRL